MKKTVIKFYAEWCGPCRQYGPIFKKVKEDLEDIVDFVEVDVDKDTENISAKYKVKGIPMTVLVEGEEVKKSISGRMSENQLKEFILN